MPLNKANISDEPKTPAHAKVNLAKVISPLSPKTKQKFFEKIKNADPQDLKKALIHAALTMCGFPGKLYEKVAVLQAVLKEHKDCDEVINPIKIAIEAYINKAGFELFQTIMQEPFIEKEWNSGFLLVLARQLNIQCEKEPLVEAAIQDGKIYWQVVQAETVLYTRHESFDFSNKNSWRMSWEQFRQFKDSGKRSGTVAVTQKRFVDFFEEKYQQQAAAVWSELKKKNVLNKRNRLANGWRAMAGDKLELTSLTDPDQVISKWKVVECLKDFRDTGKLVTREKFIKYWDDKYKCRAGLIWDKLITEKSIDVKGRVKSLNFEAADFLNTLHLKHEAVVDALNKTANNAAYKEILNNLPGAAIYRPERTPKSGAKTSSVQNYEPSSSVYCTKLWDVGTFSELTLHRNTPNELELNHDIKLNYDHIPSCDALKIKAIGEKQAPSETEKHGNLWWTIAVPEQLHKQGETFLQSSQDQQKSTEHQLLHDVRAYLDILDKRAEDFSFTVDDYIKAVGAFRYLYRCQVKPPTPIAGVHKVGLVPQPFSKKQKIGKRLINYLLTG